MIIPTILTADLAEAKDKLSLLKGQVSRVQLDIIDGQFINNQTIKPDQLVGLEEKTDFGLDFHLMVVDPVSYLSGVWPGETDLITAQIESMPSQVEFIRLTKEAGFKAGLAVDLTTDLAKLDLQALDMVDQVLLLAVKAGFSGQEIDSQILPKIKELSVWRRKERWSFRVAVDGGIDETSLAFCQKMGADDFYVGSTIWQSKQPLKTLANLEKLIVNQD